MSEGDGEAEGEVEASELPRFGDQVDHPVFGLCDVMLVKERRIMKIREVASMRLREIHLSAVRVLVPSIVSKKRVFRLTRRD